MQNIAIPGVFPGFIALLLAFTAFRAYNGYRKTQNKRYRSSMILCIIGAVLFVLLAAFQLAG